MSLLDMDVRELKLLREFASIDQCSRLRFFRWLRLITSRELIRRDRQRIARPVEVLPRINPSTYDVREVLFTMTVGLEAIEKFTRQGWRRPSQFISEAMTALADGDLQGMLPDAVSYSNKICVERRIN